MRGSIAIFETETDFPSTGDPKTRVLFSKHGVALDKLGRDEVTPEVFAKFIADLLLLSLRPGAVGAADAASSQPWILEACAGLGGNTIQFALAGAKVTAVEIDEMKTQRNNITKLGSLTMVVGRPGQLPFISRFDMMDFRTGIDPVTLAASYASTFDGEL